MSYFIPIPVWGFKQSNTDFSCAVGRCVKFIDPINVLQIGVHKQTIRFVNEYFILFTSTLKIIFLTINYFIQPMNILFGSFIQ